MTDLREKLRGDIQAVEAAALVPHHHRGALFILDVQSDLLEVAMAIAGDDASAIEGLVRDQRLRRPSLGELADWCVDLELRFQFVILQPYVLAQPIAKPPKPPSN